MMFMNEYEVSEALGRFSRPGFDNLHRAALILANLVVWTNRSSDGWAYWPKPCRAARQLQELLQGVDRFDPEDVTEAQVRKALVPIKAFLTRQGVSHETIIGQGHQSVML